MMCVAVVLLCQGYCQTPRKDTRMMSVKAFIAIFHADKIFKEASVEVREHTKVNNNNLRSSSQKLHK